MLNLKKNEFIFNPFSFKLDRHKWTIKTLNLNSFIRSFLSSLNTSLFLLNSTLFFIHHLVIQTYFVIIDNWIQSWITGWIHFQPLKRARYINGWINNGKLCENQKYYVLIEDSKYFFVFSINAFNRIFNCKTNAAYNVFKVVLKEETEH